MSPRLYIPTIILILLITLEALYGFYPAQPTTSSAQAIESLPATQAYVLPVSESTYLPILNTGSKQPLIQAKSALVFDLQSRRPLFVKNSDTPLPIASLTKIMTAVIVYEKLKLDDIVTIGRESIKADEEKQDLFLDEKLSVRDLLTMMLVQSSNDAAFALTAHAQSKGINFLAEMNQKTYDLGMSKTKFIDPAGLNDQANSTTEDLARLIGYAMKYPDLWSITLQSSASIYSLDNQISHSIKTTNQLLNVLPGLIGGKTGYTEGALGCMILIAQIPGYDSKVASIVLGSTDRFGDTQRLISWTTQAYRWE